MKKIIGLFVLVAFAITLASVAFGRTLEEEKTAVRDYLNVIDKKIVKARNLKQTAKMKKLQTEKAGTLKRWAKLQAEMTAAPGVPPVAPVPPAAPVVAKPAASAGLFGMGINTLLSGSYISTGKGQISGGLVARGDVVLDDFVGLGSMVGLGANAIKYNVGLGYAVGGGSALKAFPLYVGGTINLPADMMGGLETFLAGGVNYVVYGNGKTTGKIGIDAGIGLRADLGLGLGKTGFELGYSAIRSNTVTDKGVCLTISQPIVL